ncbi:hypothetical protein D9756_011352 [Leucocoprinus leucothites]|uniref:HSF-type DNA-binding domain-containing protein n=1 Tax=Leucocoprinus leucothites TaxID=201217 RepID=A0A8H5CP15_9AGAR|nr:hypothetical protein D9756_011352 [Leucoagaricus leucothites]
MDGSIQGSSRPAHFLRPNNDNHLRYSDHSPTTTTTPTTHNSWDSKHEHQSSMNQHGDPSSSHDDPMPSTSDFVKKLYKMLEDPAFQSVVSWGPQGDCFVVKDMNEFTKSILPRMFKHSNFASFVRQLNKYDFHKVKNTDDNQFGEHSWTFRHPDFHADRRDALENIKRKVPAQRKAQQAAAAAAAVAQTHVQLSLPSLGGSGGPGPSSLLGGASTNQTSSAHIQAQNQLQIEQLLLEVKRLREEGDDLRGRVGVLERNYQSVLVEMVGFQRGMAQQDGLMQSLISYFLGNENGKCF